MSAVEWTPEQVALRARLLGDTPAAGTKRCPQCEAIKPLDQFPRDRGRADGRFVYCCNCHTANNAGQGAAHARALSRLREAHPDEFARYYAEEKARPR